MVLVPPRRAPARGGAVAVVLDEGEQLRLDKGDVLVVAVWGWCVMCGGGACQLPGGGSVAMVNDRKTDGWSGAMTATASSI